MCSCGKDHAGKRQPKRFSRNFTDPWRKTPGRLIGTTLVRFYQVTLSSLIGNSCRHLPTCSEYAYEAIARHGLWVAAGWGFSRLAMRTFRHARLRSGATKAGRRHEMVSALALLAMLVTQP